MKGIHDLLIKGIAVAIGLGGLVIFFGGFGAEGAFTKLLQLAFGVFLLATAVGFARYRGWAFLVVSVALLLGFFRYAIAVVMAVDAGMSIWSPLTILLLDLALIAYLGRWGMERHFRPHLDVDHH